MYIVIVGGGKLGEYVAQRFLRNGHMVALIEESEQVARRLSGELVGSSLVICGDGCELNYQREAGTARADVFVAATGQDEDNLAACEIANRIFDVDRCIARVNSPKNVKIFRKLGIEALSVTALISRMIEEEAVLGSMSVAVAMAGDSVGLLELKIPQMKNHDNEAGVRALDIEFDEGIRAVAVSRGTDVEVVSSTTMLLPNDKLIVAADTEMIAEARRTIKAL